MFFGRSKKVRSGSGILQSQTAVGNHVTQTQYANVIVGSSVVDKAKKKSDDKPKVIIQSIENPKLTQEEVKFILDFVESKVYPLLKSRACPVEIRVRAMGLQGIFVDLTIQCSRINDNSVVLTIICVEGHNTYSPYTRSVSFSILTNTLAGKKFDSIESVHYTSVDGVHSIIKILKNFVEKEGGVINGLQ